MKSPKELSINDKLIKLTKEVIGLTQEKDELPLRIMEILVSDEEIQEIQDYANTVSIVRLGFNDHGPVHMRTVCKNALQMLKILYQANIRTSLEVEQSGTFLDSVSAVAMASFMHDFGMTIGRQDHELYSGILAYDVVNRILEKLLPGKSDLRRKVTIRSLALEGIIGHMGGRKIHSLEAGLIQIADGCDMTKGRARIPMELNRSPSIGDIHKYSANSIEKVQILTGEEKPIRIEVNMSADVGFFQIEEVLLHKINSSPAKSLVELFAGVDGSAMKRYL
ncbi:MAG: phosphohydrolase [Treponema sp.]|uniref:phosphohydrolase n=1 Tax=Treponema sp. TaxID=166 RepID=UPI0025D53674|nr:phosphohydrolase [Treponema sp.]MBQ9283305.1 phosphohydrolase [Treponema sp.]MBR1713794.1 phosphohydrolase [Treponema sp.]